MKTNRFVCAFVLLACTCAQAAERAIEKSIEVAAMLDQVWGAWTTREGIVAFFAPDAKIDARPGGAFEIHFDPLAPPGTKGADGMRNLPDGKPFTIRYASRPDSLGRQQDEMWKKAFDSIGIRMEVQKDKFAELLKLEKQCKLMMRTAAWIADYPDGDNFMQLLYGPNAGQENQARFRLPEYDKLYDAARFSGRTVEVTATTALEKVLREETVAKK